MGANGRIIHCSRRPNRACGKVHLVTGKVT
jgi:hypothetical protein